MVWYDDVRFKQRAVDKFPVAEKKLVRNVHERLQNLFDISAVDKSTVSSCVSRTVGSAKQLRQVMGKLVQITQGPTILHMFCLLVVSSIDLQINPLRLSPSYSATDSQSLRLSVKSFRLARGPEIFFSLGPNQVLAALLLKAKRSSVTLVALAGRKLQSLQCLYPQDCILTWIYGLQINYNYNYNYSSVTSTC